MTSGRWLVIALDIETNDRSRYAAEVIQLAVVLLDARFDDKHAARLSPVDDGAFCTLVRPNRPCSRHAEAAHGITVDALSRAEPFPVAFEKLVQHVRSHAAGAARVVLAGHNVVGFDLPILWADCQRHRLDFFELRATHCLDTLVWAKATLAHSVPQHTMSAVYRATTGRELVNAHRADVDAAAVAAVLQSSAFAFGHWSTYTRCLFRQLQVQTLRARAFYAQKRMRTPMFTCRTCRGKEKNDALSLASKLH